LIDGAKIVVTIKAGTKVGSFLRIPNKGLSPQHVRSSGDLLLEVKLDIPTEVSDPMRKALEKLKKIK